jgi:multiple sugar transport system substrate-binding protein
LPQESTENPVQSESSVYRAPHDPDDNEEENSHKFNSRKILKIVALISVACLVLIGILIFITSLRSKPKDENVTLSYWGVNEDEKVMNSIISDFEKENPTIKVEYIKQDRKGYREKLSVRMKNGSGPDIFGFHNTWYPMFSDILLPLPKEVIEKSEFQNNYYDVVGKDLIRNGAIYGIPLGIDTLVMYINPDIFNQAGAEQGTTFSIPKTWQDFIDVSAKLTKRDENGKIDISGGGIGTYENINHAPDIISLLFLQNGVDINNLAKSPQKIDDALKFYTNFALVENNIWDQTLDNSLLAFSKGKLAMFFGYADDYNEIKSLNPDLSFKIVPVPQLLKDKPVNIASYWAEGVSSQSVYQKQAFLFMKFLARPEVQQKLYAENVKNNRLGRPYSNKNLEKELQSSEIYPVLGQANTALSSPFVDNTFDNGLNDNLDAYLKDIVNSLLSNSSSGKVSEALSQGFSDVISGYSPSSSK